MSLSLLTFGTVRARLVGNSGLVTASGSSTATTGSLSAGSNSLVVAAATSFSVGHGIKVAGAGIGGGDLATWITAIVGTTFTLNSKAVGTVVAAAVTHDDRAVIAAAAIIPQYGEKPVVFPCIGMRFDGAEGNTFRETMSGKLYVSVFYQSEPDETGQPAEVLSLMMDRIKSLLHRNEVNMSNDAVRIDMMVEGFRTGVLPEVNISETTHSQTATYDYKSQLL